MEPPPVTPESVKKLGIELGITVDDKTSLNLLAVARLLLTLPLPTSYKHALSDESGQWESVYIDKRTGLTTPKHPNLEAAKKLVAKLRQQSGGSSARAANDTQASQPDQQPAAPQAEPDSEPEPSAEGAQAEQAGDAEAESAPGAAQPPAPAEESAQSTGDAGRAQAASTSGNDNSSGSSTAKQTVMGFTKPDGTPYYYDFATESEVEGEPANGTVIEAPASDLVQEAGMAPQSASDIKALKFYSWWYEDIESSDLTLRVSGNSEAGGGLKRRYVTVEYDLPSQSFGIRSVTDEQELAISNILAVTSKSGGTVEVWDLHVGATLNIMGRSLALMKADGSTGIWIDHHAKRLKKLKATLLGELQKYRPRGHKPAVTHDRGDKASGGLSLRYTVNQINTMLDELQQYRPSVAAKLRTQIQI
uniref:WW domain-containing protein n=1 Tax=Chlamydomonas leiostraca TaxID=1034604 RepID=A0A7S0RGA9_9CHLO